MSFDITNFSPVGGNARGGNLPFQVDPPSENSIQVFTYSTVDNLGLILANDYFKELGGGRYLRRGDWIDIASDIDGTPGQSLRFVLGVGLFPSALTAVVVAGGTGYNVGDLVTVTYTDGTIDQKTVLEVLTETGNVVDTVGIVDPGFFSVAPTALTALATVGGNNDLTVTITLATQPSDALVTLSPLSIVAS
jgi:hypothetical protein